MWPFILPPILRAIRVFTMIVGLTALATVSVVAGYVFMRYQQQLC